MKLDNDLYVKHLQGMIKYPTVSSVDPEKIDMEAFLAFHKYLEETYPLVHKTMTKEVFGKVGLLYHWKGTGKSGKLPLMLTAHQDVVPEGDHSMWKYPPYEGVIAEGCLWGRGTTDSKCNIQAYMDALEALIADGFVPDYDIYLGFGYNEEIMGGPGAAGAILADLLKNRGIELGLEIDECGGIMQEGDKLVAQIFPSEKGYADFEFSMKDPGGHSAQPGEHSSLGVIGKTACILEENVLPQRLEAPTIEQMKAMAPFLEGELAELFKDPEANWETLKPIMAKDRTYNAMTRTTTAVTMARGSDQANILPERAWLVINNRLLAGDTLESLQKFYESIVPEGVEVKLLKGHNMPTVSSTDTVGYRLIQSIVEKKYPGITMMPSLLLGGTDARYYCDICPSHSVYRFTGLRYSSKWGGAHQVNERIDTDILADNVEFYVELIKGYGSAK